VFSRGYRDNPTVCGGASIDGSDPSGGVLEDRWCWGYGVGPAEAGTRSFHANLCRTLDAGAGTLHFPPGPPVDVVVMTDRDGGNREYWRWSRGQTFGQAAPVTVEAGECAVWTVTYDLADDRGKPLPPGSYVAVLSVLATELGTRNVRHIGFTV
jgi:hypothetical protein